MSSYKDLSDNVDDSFSFSLRGKKYEMRYPKTGELEEIQELNTRYEAIDKTSEEAKEIESKLTDAIYKYISPVGHDTKIKAALRQENIKVLKNFNVMIKAELAV